MERVFDFQMGKVKTKLIKICSLVEEQFELIHESFKKYDPQMIEKVFEKNNEIQILKERIENNCQKVFVLTQPVANDLRDVLLYLKINELFNNYHDSIINIIKLIEKHSIYNISQDLKDIYEASYSTLDLIKSSFDAFIVTDIELANRIVSSKNQFGDLIETNTESLKKIIKSDNSTIEAVFNILTLLSELMHIKKYCIDLCEDVIILNQKKE